MRVTLGTITLLCAMYCIQAGILMTNPNNIDPILEPDPTGALNKLLGSREKTPGNDTGTLDKPLGGPEIPPATGTGPLDNLRGGPEIAPGTGIGPLDNLLGGPEIPPATGTGPLDNLLGGPEIPPATGTGPSDNLRGGPEIPPGTGIGILDKPLGGPEISPPGTDTVSLDNLLAGREIFPPGNDTVGSKLSDREQARLDGKCRRNCKTEVCYLADRSDCRNFITCKQDGTGTYTATRQPCAFGTYWAGLLKQKKITCDIPDNVLCPIDYCGGRPEGYTFDHDDGKCNTYWECNQGKPTAKCCNNGMIYHKGNRTCGVDYLKTCHDICAIKQDACLIPGTKTEYFDDNRCLTYWDCEAGHPHPVCCEEGYGYDILAGGCILDPMCKDICPDQYKPDICLKPGVEKYSLLDNHCRTFMRCNAIEGDERWCCTSGNKFDSDLQKCIEKTDFMNDTCDDICPGKYNEECSLKPAKTPDQYIQLVHGMEIERPCANGAHFDVKKCGCALRTANSSDNSCAKEFSMLFDQPIGENIGSQKAIEVAKFGNTHYGPSLNGRKAFKSNGDSLLKLPFFQSEFVKFFFKIIYLPSLDVPQFPQILLSNCIGIDLKRPSLEISIQGGQLVLDVLTNSEGQTATPRIQEHTLRVPYTPGVWNAAYGYYDGSEMAFMNEGDGLPKADFVQVNGTVPIAAEGLHMPGCLDYQHLQTHKIINGFVGSVAELQFTKCLHEDWVKEFKSKLIIPKGL